MKNNLEDYSRYCQVVGATDIGCKRAANEDFLGYEDTLNGRVAVVCDGMGGHVGGATASHIAVDSILAYLREHYHADPNEAIVEAVSTANRNILHHAQIHPELTGMGSTCVLLLVRNGKVYIGHVGDSRIYLIRESTIKQLTKDHSFVQTLVDAGQISEAEAELHPRKNEITNALGIPHMQPATVREEPILPQAGDVFLLCSDGLSNMVPNPAIAKIAGRIGTDMQHRADILIEHARKNGGLDNITCELVEFSITTFGKGDRSQNDDKRKKSILWLSILAAALLLLGGGGYFFWQQFTPRYFDKNLGMLKISADKTICTIIFQESGTLIRNSSGDSLWSEPGFKADSDSIRYDADKLTVSKEGSDRISLQIKDGTNIRETENWSFSLQDGRHKGDFHFKVIPSDPEYGKTKAIAKRPVIHENLGSVKVTRKRLLVSITPGYSSYVEIKNAKGKLLWKRSVPEMTQDSIQRVSSKIEIQSKNGSTTTILLKEKNDYPQNDSIVFSINSPDTIFTFSVQLATEKTPPAENSATSKGITEALLDSAKKSISPNYTDTIPSGDKTTDENADSKGNTGRKPVTEEKPSASSTEESDPPGSESGTE